MPKIPKREPDFQDDEFKFWVKKIHSHDHVSMYYKGHSWKAAEGCSYCTYFHGNLTYKHTYKDTPGDWDPTCEDTSLPVIRMLEAHLHKLVEKELLE